jgi:8-oxo-dGTP pyrophosphatase MutT (NUDIX family)
MKEYVVGLMFNVTLEEVLLIQKNRPAEQVGKLNGLGGKIKLNEDPHVAMVREFENECGLVTTRDDWRLLGDMYNYDVKIYFFMGKSSDILHAESTTDEYVDIYDIANENIFNYDLADGLSWVIPMCRDKNMSYFSVEIK